MSLLNVWVEAGDALVAVDTDGVGLEGEKIVASKMLPIPHLCAVIALRGQAAFLATLYLSCLSFESFDEMVEAMPTLADRVSMSVPEELIVANGTIGRGYELAVVGYSPRRERMFGRTFIDREGVKSQRDVVDAFISPWHSSLRGTSTKRDNVAGLVGAQIQWMRKSFANAACGGRVIVCRLMHGGFIVSHAFDEAKPV